MPEVKEKKKRHIRLIDVPQEDYLVLLQFKAMEEQRLKRACNLTDGFSRMAKEAGKKINNITEVTIGEPGLSVSIKK